MNLKQRFSIIFSLLFSLLLGGVLIFIFAMYAHFRKEEFEMRLAEKAETTVKFLLEVNEIDYQLLKIIDKNTIQRLYNEKVLIFDENKKLVYSSIDDEVLKWDPSDLNYLKENKSFFRSQNEYDVYGMYYDSQNKDYYALVTAEDVYGKRKLKYLQYLLWTAFGIGTISSWFLSWYLSKRSLQPLDLFTLQIGKISDQNLNVRLPDSGQQDEISQMSRSFNQMLSRIDEAYKKQREFTGNASHELRTPISRITTQLENILQDEKLDPKLRESLHSITEEAFQLSDIVVSLLLLSKIENHELLSESFKKIRLDELIFSSSSNVKKIYPDLKLQFEISSQGDLHPDLEISGEDSLLQIAFNNIIKNAYLYSSDQVVSCKIVQEPDKVVVSFNNKGPNPDQNELESLFQAFSRGTNSSNKPGSRLGLLIVKRILHYHQAEINFLIPTPGTNSLQIVFKTLRQI